MPTTTRVLIPVVASLCTSPDDKQLPFTVRSIAPPPFLETEVVVEQDLGNTMSGRSACHFLFLENHVNRVPPGRSALLSAGARAVQERPPPEWLFS